MFRMCIINYFFIWNALVKFRTLCVAISHGWAVIPARRPYSFLIVLKIFIIHICINDFLVNSAVLSFINVDTRKLFSWLTLERTFPRMSIIVKI